MGRPRLDAIHSVIEDYGKGLYLPISSENTIIKKPYGVILANPLSAFVFYGCGLNKNGDEFHLLHSPIEKPVLVDSGINFDERLDVYGLNPALTQGELFSLIFMVGDREWYPSFDVVESLERMRSAGANLGYPEMRREVLMISSSINRGY